MDVLHITHQFAPETRGGVESYVRDVTNVQRGRGQDVQVLTGSHEGWARPGIEDVVLVDGLPVHRLHRDDRHFDFHAKAWHPMVGQLVEEFLARTKPRVVHIHQWIRLTSNLVEIVQAQGIPAVVSLHDFYTSCPRAFRVHPVNGACRLPLSVESCLDCVPYYGHESRDELAEGIELYADQCRAELEMANAVLVGLASTADLIASTTGVSRDCFQVLHLGYEHRFPGVESLPSPRADETFRFAFWGGVAPHKGIRVLLDAFEQLVAAGTAQPVELHVLGGFATPDLELELRERAASLPVHFHGPFTLAELLAVAPHVGVFPSTCLETHGIVLDECFELGLPCIVTEDGAMAERASGAALCVRLGDAAHLSSAMVRCLDGNTWRSLREQIPPPSATIEQHCDALEQAYRTAVLACANGRTVPSPLSARRREVFLLRQRESALATIDPEGRLP